MNQTSRRWSCSGGGCWTRKRWKRSRTETAGVFCTFDARAGLTATCRVQSVAQGIGLDTRPVPCVRPTPRGCCEPGTCSKEPTRSSNRSRSSGSNCRRKTSAKVCRRSIRLPKTPTAKALSRLIQLMDEISIPMPRRLALPPDRVAALRDAFKRTRVEPEFVPEARRAGMLVYSQYGAKATLRAANDHSPPKVVTELKVLEPR